MKKLLLRSEEFDLEEVNENNIVDCFRALLEDTRNKELIIIEVANRILSLSPITHYDQESIKLGNPDFTTIDNIIGNSLGKHKVYDVLFNNGAIFLKTCNVSVKHEALHESLIPNEILLDIVRSIFLGEESEITDKIPINEVKEASLMQIENILNIGE